MADPGLTSIVLEGFRGCYADGGRGQAVVLLASPFARAAVYRPTVEALRRHFRVIVVEMPGCGCGSRLAPGWGFDDYARWASAFLDATNLTDVLLIGHSNSAAVAIRVAASHPSRLAGVVLADTVGARGPRSVLAVLAGCAACIPLEPWFVLSVAPRTVLNLWRHTRNFLKQFWRSVKADVRDVAPHVKVPTLVAWGALDYVMPVSGVESLMRLLPNAKAYVAPRGSHDWLVARSDEFAAAVGQFAEATTGAAR